MLLCTQNCYCLCACSWVPLPITTLWVTLLLRGGASRTGLEPCTQLGGVSLTPHMHSAIALQSCLPAPPWPDASDARLIPICFVFSCAAAWIVFTWAVSSCALWALPTLYLSFSPLLMQLLCFTPMYLPPSCYPCPSYFPCSFFFFLDVPRLQLTFVLLLLVVLQPLGFQGHLRAVSPSTMSSLLQLSVCLWRMWEIKSSLCSLLSSCQLTLK